MAFKYFSPDYYEKEIEDIWKIDSIYERNKKYRVFARREIKRLESYGKVWLVNEKIIFTSHYTYNCENRDWSKDIDLSKFYKENKT